MKSSIPMTFGTKTQADFSFSKMCDEADYAYPLHWHDCFEILWVRRGTFGIRTSEEKITLVCDDMMLLPPCALHGTFACTEEYETYVLGYTDSIIYSPDISFDNKKYLSPFRINPAPRVIRSDHPASCNIRTCLWDVVQVCECTDFARELRVRAAILMLHASLYSAIVEENVREDSAGHYILEAERYIESRITENISPYQIADALHISYSHFARLLHANYGYSAGELIARMKISYAERMMHADAELSVTDIAAAVGYGSASYFARQFRKLRGCSPNEFRKLLTCGDENPISPIKV